MALNASGPISLAGTITGQSIEIENGGNGTTQISLNDTAVRSLAGSAFSTPNTPIQMPTDFWGKSNSIPFGAAQFIGVQTNPPTNTVYSFVVPTGATTICAVCIGGGGSAKTNWEGSGAALSYTNDIPVTAGETLTVSVGVAGLWVSSTVLYNGGESFIARGGTKLISAQGGFSGTFNNQVPTGGQASAGIGAVRYSGGNATNGGGGPSAAGYSANGVSGIAFAAGVSGQGGSGGSGGSSSGNRCGNGGGTGIIAAGSNGAGGAYNGTGTGGGGGDGSINAGGVGYGGAGGAHGDSTAIMYGQVGAIRIIYGGVNKNYPNNSAP